jgi:hypothetical protein
MSRLPEGMTASHAAALSRLSDYRRELAEERACILHYSADLSWEAADARAIELEAPQRSLAWGDP